MGPTTGVLTDRSGEEALGRRICCGSSALVDAAELTIRPNLRQRSAQWNVMLVRQTNDLVIPCNGMLHYWKAHAHVWSNGRTDNADPAPFAQSIAHGEARGCPAMKALEVNPALTAAARSAATRPPPPPIGHARPRRKSSEALRTAEPVWSISRCWTDCSGATGGRLWVLTASMIFSSVGAGSCTSAVDCCGCWSTDCSSHCRASTNRRYSSVVSSTVPAGQARTERPRRHSPSRKVQRLA